jgi:hypothetical protein
LVRGDRFAGNLLAGFHRCAKPRNGARLAVSLFEIPEG